MALLEFFLGGDPNVPSSHLIPWGGISTMDVSGVAGEYFTLNFQTRIAAEGSIHVVEFSTDLENWSADGVLVRQALTGNNDGLMTEVWRAPAPWGAHARLIARLRVTN